MFLFSEPTCTPMSTDPWILPFLSLSGILRANCSLMVFPCSVLGVLLILLLLPSHLLPASTLWLYTACQVASVVSNSMWPHGLQPSRLLYPWDSPGNNTGVGCHFLLQCMKVESESEVTQSCLTLSDPMDCSPPGSSIHGIFRATVLEWGAIAWVRLTIL